MPKEDPEDQMEKPAEGESLEDPACLERRETLVPWAALEILVLMVTTE